MKKLGIWPKQFPSLMYQIKGLLSMFFIAANTITILVGVFRHFSNVQSTSFGLCCALSTFLTFNKCLALFLNKNNYLKILLYLKHATLPPHENNLNIYLQRKMKMCSQFRIVYRSAAVCTGILIIMGCLFNVQYERSLPLLFPVDMKDQPLVIYISVWCYESAGIILTCLSTACLDGMIFTFISVASAQLRILREKIIRSTEAYSTDSRHLQVENAINNVLKECIKQHIVIERYVATIEETFQYIFLIHLIVSVLAACFAAFNFVLIPISSIDFGKSIVFFVTMAIQLILLCVSGNEVIRQSEKIHDACYMTNWEQCGPTVRKTLFIIMERSKRPLKLTAANFAELSIDTLMQVFKSAFSYFTVLRRMYSDSNNI